MNRHRARGYSLILVILSIALFVTFGVLAMPVLRSAVTTITGCRQQTANLAATDHLLNTLRNDVWQADKVECKDDRTLTISQGDSAPIVWSFAETVRRQSAMFPGVAANMRVSVDGAAVRLKLTDFDVTFLAPRPVMGHAS